MEKMMSKHTPGPWSLYCKTKDEIVVRKINKDMGELCKIADVYGYGNARLIAAAPELLEALENLVSLCEAGLNGEYNIEAELAEPRAAITKATGDQP
jgi:hypothetical protein